MAFSYNWRKPFTNARRKTLCVLPFPGFPHPIKITDAIAGTFHGPIPSPK